MSNITVKFIGKEYTIPEDILTYIELLNFTDSVQKRLSNAFVRKLKSEISKGNVACLDDKVMAPDIEQQVGKFIAKLTEHGIYDRTINDYLRENEGYKLISKVNAAALEEAKRVFQQQISDWIEGYEDAIQKKDASVTGLSFSILSGSFVNHAIYAAMEASKVNEQEKAAAKEYQKDMAELDARLASRKNEAEKQYVANTYIPHMEAAITVFSYELLDTFVSDLIKYGKINQDLLNYVHIDRSNDLLKNLELSQNKEVVLLKAFEACPYNIAVYMRAMKYDLLDYDTFETANVFKQASSIISFLKDSLGAADYPNFVEPNYYSASLLARYENKSTNDVLYQHTSSYANAVIREYGKIVKALDSPHQCRDYLRKLNDDEVLSGEGTSKRLAKSLVYSIVSNDNWNILVKQCGHADLLERLQAIMPVGSSLGSKADCDSYLAETLFNALEVARKDLAQRILESRARAEAEQQKVEAQKRKKRIKTTAILCAIVAAIIVAISLPSIIENVKTAKRESYVEEQIQAIIVPLDKEMEDATGVDVIINYYFSLEEDWDYDREQWYEWTLSVSLPIFEEYRKSGNASEQSLLKVMDVCKTLVEIYDDVYDDLDFEFRHENARVVMRFFGGNFGSLKIHDMSTSETFYYEEYGGDRYLHSSDTEYVLDKNSEVVQAAEKEAAYNDALSLMTTQKYDEAIEIFAKLSGYKDSFIKITECENAIIELKYNEALTLMSAQKYDDAVTIFTELGEYKNSAAKIIECNNTIAAIIESKYNEASSLIAKGKYNEAIVLLEEIGDYKDAVVLKQKCTLLTCETGDVITFGTYEQDGNSSNGTEAIEWIVLKRDGNKAFVLSLYCLEQMPFNNKLTSVTWANCSLRKWLNNTFLINAFSQVEQAQIVSTKVFDEGKQTTDKVFLLSEDETVDYLTSRGRRADATEHVSTSQCYWFLRTTGSVSNVAYVSYDGEVGYYEDVDRNWWVRPAMWIEISE